MSLDFLHCYIFGSGIIRQPPFWCGCDQHGVECLILEIQVLCQDSRTLETWRVGMEIGTAVNAASTRCLPKQRDCEDRAQTEHRLFQYDSRRLFSGRSGRYLYTCTFIILTSQGNHECIIPRQRKFETQYYQESNGKLPPAQDVPPIPAVYQLSRNLFVHAACFCETHVRTPRFEERRQSTFFKPPPPPYPVHRSTSTKVRTQPAQQQHTYCPTLPTRQAGGCRT